MLIKSEKDWSWVRKQCILSLPLSLSDMGGPCSGGQRPSFAHLWIPLTHTHPSCTVLHNWKYSLKCWFKRNELIGLNYFIWHPCDLQATVECIFVGNSIHLYNVSAPPCDYSAANLTMRKWRHIFFICFHFLSRVFRREPLLRDNHTPMQRKTTLKSMSSFLETRTLCTVT